MVVRTKPKKLQKPKEADKDQDEISSIDSSDEEDIGEEEKAKRRQKFLKDVDVLVGKTPKRNKKASRTEPSREISEFSWSTGSGEKLQLQDLLNSVQSNKTIAKVKKKLQKMENTTKVLEKPLTEPETQRVLRAAGYDSTSKTISQWNSTIQRNREADTLSFPLNQFNPPKMTEKTMISNFKPQNDLEREISAVLKGSEYILERKNKELTEAEEDALKAFNLEDALERRKELQKARALQSYYEAKCRRMKKIKSKKYHRIKRKEEQKKVEKTDLGALSQDNPELFKSELEKAEKLRALERASLRHRNTSKWAKNLITKGHKTKESPLQIGLAGHGVYDKLVERFQDLSKVKNPAVSKAKEREGIREQLRISRSLTDHKLEREEASDVEDENEVDVADHLKLLRSTEKSDNPWLLGGGKSLDGENGENNTESSKSYKKLTAISSNELLEEQVNDDTDKDSVNSEDEWDKAAKQKNDMENGKKKTKKKLKSKKVKTEKKAILNNKNESNDALGNTTNKKNANDNNKNNTEILQSKNSAVKTIGGKLKPQLDPLKFLKSDKDAVDFITEEEDSSDDDVIYDTEQRMNIREAFANDDVIGDFVNDKKEITEKSKPKPVDLTLPGWGEWAGAGLKVSSKKRKRFQKDPGPAPKRKDDRIPNVIINEERNTKLAKHQVGQVPFPFSNKEEFERSIRQPIGETWNAPSVFNKLIEPRIRTTPGVIIDPLKPTKKMKKILKQT